MAIGDAIQQKMPGKSVHYHHNPKAVIQGPILFSYQLKPQKFREEQTQIIIYDGEVCVTKDPQPCKNPENIIASFDLAAPSFKVDDVMAALKRHYKSRRR